MFDEKEIEKLKITTKKSEPVAAFSSATTGSADELLLQEICKPDIESIDTFEYRDEVKLRRLTKTMKTKIKNITKDSVGRVVAIKEDGIVEVDFWNTVPARFPIKTGLLKLHKKAKPLEDDTKKSNPTENETQSKPSRYTQGSMEVWDAIEALNLDFMQGNVLKYISRYKLKNKDQDLIKAMNYILKMYARETKQDYYVLRKKTLDNL